MYVICFYWQGDRWQQNGFQYDDPSHVNLQQQFLRRVGNVSDDLPARYVNNLYKGVKRFADREFKFICFSNEKLNVLPEIELRPFKQVTQTGVLPRLYMFSEEAGLFGHQVLCLDIDVVIVGSLKDIMGYDGKFCARSKFKFGEGHKLDGDIMSFQAGKETEVMFWKPFIRDIKAAEKLTQGRERYWFRHIANDTADRWDEFAPGQIISYKRHVIRDEMLLAGKHLIPKDARIVSCHGVPRPDQIEENWITQYWK